MTLRVLLSSSGGMKRILATKYRMPSRVVPSHLEANGLVKCLGPLQPEKLERRYYGEGGGGVGGACGGGGGTNDGGGGGHHRRNDDDNGYQRSHHCGGYDTTGGGGEGGGGGGVLRRRHRPSPTSAITAAVNEWDMWWGASGKKGRHESNH